MSKPTARHGDVSLSNYGSIIHFHLHSATAREWVSEHVAEIPSYQSTHDGFYADHRPARDIISGMQADGLKVRE